MVRSGATTPDEYIAALPDERREAIAAVRRVINENLPDGYTEGMSHGMIAWWVPLETYGDTYNGEPLGLAGVASQKNYIALYLLNVYGDPALDAWFRERWAQSGKKLDMGKSCVRFRKLDEVPLEVIGETIAKSDLASFLANYDGVRGSARAARKRS